MKFFQILILFIAAVSFPVLIDASQLEPQPVIIRSTFFEQSNLPVFKEHQYDLLQPKSIDEPYLPKLFISDFDIPEAAPQSLHIHWTAKLSKNLSSLFFGDIGVLQTGIHLVHKDKLDEAISVFQSIRSIESDEYHWSRLWMAWIYKRQKNYQQSKEILQFLKKASNPEIAAQAHFLLASIGLSNNEIGSVFKELEALSSSINPSNWSDSLKYSYLVSMVKLEKWNDADRFSQSWMQNPKYYSRLYPKISQIQSLIAYEKKDYSNALRLFQVYLRSSPSRSNHFENIRQLAWLFYFNGEYNKSLAQLSRGLKRNIQYLNETNYLKLLDHAAASRWKDVEQALNRIPKNNRFYSYSLFKLRSHLASIKTFSDLYDQVIKDKSNIPRTGFYLNFISGNQFFNNKLYAQAQNSYNTAFTDEDKTQHYSMALYNLGLTLIKLQKFPEAAELFEALFQREPIPFKRKISYHLLFVTYQQQNLKRFREIYLSIDLKQYPMNIKQEILFMIGAAALIKRENKTAAQAFGQRLQYENNPRDLELLALSYYQDSAYKEVLDLLKDTDLNQDRYFSLRAKSLLGLGKPHEALDLIQSRKFKGDQLIQLRIEIWLATKQFQTLIDQVKPLLSTSLDPDKRLEYYRNLGDTYYNLKQYQRSKTQYYKALELAVKPSVKSLIYYNIALNSLSYGDTQNFIKEARSFLNESELTEEIRYDLTLMLANHFIEENRKLEADALLADYAKSHDYHRSNAQNKRIQMLYRSGEFEKCYELAKQTPELENLLQRRDRLLNMTQCGFPLNKTNEILPAIQNELSIQTRKYRDEELQLAIANAQMIEKQYKKSIANLLLLKPGQLPDSVKLHAYFLLAANYSALGNWDKSSQFVTKIITNRQSPFYLKGLNIKAQNLAQRKKYKEATKTLLRIFYHPAAGQLEKNDLIVQIAELYMQQNSRQNAKAILSTMPQKPSFSSSNSKTSYLNMIKELGMN